MEPALPPFHPIVPKLLKKLELTPIDAIKWNVLLCRREALDDKSLLILKFGSDPRKSASISYEVKIFRGVLPDLNQDDFDRLVIPEYVDDGNLDGVQWVLTKQVQGHPLVYDWSERSDKPEVLGGKAIDPAVADYAIDVLRDLRLIDVDSLPSYVRRFKFEDWKSSLAERGQALIDRKLLQTETLSQATEILNGLPSYRYDGNMFTNGDFYPRNFIMVNGSKIAVADWVGGIDPWSFVAMHAWLMMWGNPKWQATYVKGLNEHFPVDTEEMQAGMMVESFNLAYRWRDKPEEEIGLARSQMLSYFRQALDLNYVRDIFAA